MENDIHINKCTSHVLYKHSIGEQTSPAIITDCSLRLLFVLVSHSCFLVDRLS